MPELRQDWLTGRTVIVAENRAQRPNEFAAERASGGSSSDDAPTGLLRKPPQPRCPFCRGNESQTPPPVYQANGLDGAWQVRVVPNMFPAVELTESLGIGQPAFGAHEVIIEAAAHVERMSALDRDELTQVLLAYCERLRCWRGDGRFQYALLFKNQGPRAGASLGHVHSQLLTLPVAPRTVEGELSRAAEKLRTHGQCAYCQWCAREQASAERVVLQRDGYLAFCPFASLQPLETWIFPIDHRPWFEETSSPDAFAALASVLHEVLSKLEAAVPGASYNMLLRNTPWRPELAAVGHWRIELLPRFNALAGLELATGIHINPIPPDKSAAGLRQI